MTAKCDPIPQKPGPVGGKLIRELMGALKKNGLPVPITSHILIAASAGSDSTALAQLIAKYGHKVVSRKKITLLHINHGWRGKASDEDARFIENCAEAWGVRSKIVTLEASAPPAGESWEEHARNCRKRIFSREARRKNALIFTAHQADDLVETLLWRLFTGNSLTHGGGIAVVHGDEVRPLLRIRKEHLREYLREEGLNWREDSTNHEGRFLRSKMRLELMPVVQRLFPRAVERLMALALSAQDRVLSNPASPAVTDLEGVELLVAASGLRPRKPHWEALQALIGKNPHWRGELSLPEGWKLKREIVRAAESASARPKKIVRWVLEQEQDR